MIRNSEPMEFANIKKRITEVKLDLERLEEGLRGREYRAVIAEVVTSDFDSVMRELQTIIANTEKAVF